MSSPDAYTAQVSGTAGDAGIAPVEVYEVQQPCQAHRLSHNVPFKLAVLFPIRSLPRSSLWE